MSSGSMFKVVPAVDLKAERDVYVGLPVENTNKQTFHRIPIRSACTESETGDHRLHVKLLQGQSNVVQSIQGLRRLLIKFPPVFVPGIKVFEANNDNDRTNLSMGFAMYDSRVGPSPEETTVMNNLDALASFLRRILVQCDRIRRPLKLGSENMTPEQQQVAADMMDLHVSRPVDASAGRNMSFSMNGRGDDRPMPARYCYVKLVAPDPNINEKYHTYFWTREGQALDFNTVLGYRNFQVQPFVEVEDIFVSKAVRSLQLKLRECLVVPPVERMQHRYSVCFPDRICSTVTAEDEPEPKKARVEAPALMVSEMVSAPAEDAPEPKKARVEAPALMVTEIVSAEDAPEPKKARVDVDAPSPIIRDPVATTDEEEAEPVEGDDSSQTE
jgi:hypothetical protein